MNTFMDSAPNPKDIASKPIASVDLVIFALSESGLQVLLMKRGTEPFADHWALPGGWIHVDEDTDLDTAARRVLFDKTGVETPYLEQLQTFGGKSRDPRGWSLSIAYVALISAHEVRLRQGSNATDVAWWSRRIGLGGPATARSARALRNAVRTICPPGTFSRVSAGSSV